MKIPLSITLEDIADGIRRDCHECPVALAMIRAGCAEVQVGPYWMIFTFHGSHKIITPFTLAQFMNAFDARESVSPFQYTLSV